MKKAVRRCLKCNRPIPAGRWLCPACRLENSEFAAEAEGVSNLYDDEG
ncbi:MAG: hypothetical protein JRJ59_04590 [Deltaproteobacteria bacterium]|nr:hypothetical protein [Deltaproteobacteria bacterium]